MFTSAGPRRSRLRTPLDALRSTPSPHDSAALHEHSDRVHNSRNRRAELRARLGSVREQARPSRGHSIEQLVDSAFRHGIGGPKHLHAPLLLVLLSLTSPKQAGKDSQFLTPTGRYPYCGPANRLCSTGTADNVFRDVGAAAEGRSIDSHYSKRPGDTT